MKKYAKWINPQVKDNVFRNPPIKPQCFLLFYGQPLDFDFTSDDDNKRAEYWEVDLNLHKRVEAELPLMTVEEVNMEIFGIPTLPEVISSPDWD